MAKFKTWEDFILFYEKYVTCSCINCKWGNAKENTGVMVCMKTLSPIQLNLVQLCVEWENEDGQTLYDYEGEYEFKLSENTIKMISEKDGRLSFEEIEAIINECERDD